MNATVRYCCIVLFALQVQAVAQTEFPSRPLRYVVPLPPGAGADFIGRTVAERMSADLGKPVVVENRAGASGSIGSEYVARSATTDLLGGQVDAMFPSLVTALPHIKAGRLRALAVSAARRSPLLPVVPTVAESGYAQFDSLQWYALCAPAGTPKQIVERLKRSLNAALTSPEVRDRLGEQAADVLPTTPAEAADTIRREVAKWSKLVKDSGLKLEQ